MLGNPHNETAAGQRLFDVAMAALALGFKLRALGKRTGSVNRWGGGTWGLLRSLKLGGPQTVPDLARARPVARQHIQILADEMARNGLVAFAANPAHKRSKLVRLTPKGERAHDEMTRKAAALTDAMARGLDERDLALTAKTLAEILRRVEAALATLPDNEAEEAPKRRRKNAGA